VTPTEHRARHVTEVLFQLKPSVASLVLHVAAVVATLILLLCLVRLHASPEAPRLHAHTELNVDAAFAVDAVEDKRSFRGSGHNITAFDGKPPRVVRSGNTGSSVKSQGEQAGQMGCGMTIVADAGASYDHCPEECPFFAQNKADDRHCTFACVRAEQCAQLNPEAPIADAHARSCMAPSVNNCQTYAMDGTDSCAECQEFFYLGADRKCHYRFMGLLYLLLAVLIAAVVFLIFWITDLSLRPIFNKDGRQVALDMRSRQKLHAAQDGDDKLWPLSTNLLKTNVAGPGMILHFNFQLMVITWALLIACGWAILAITIDNDLFVLGTRGFGTAYDNCILVAWGHETQQRLMPIKIYFLVYAYLISFLICFLHSVRQLRLFQEVDDKNKTMKDYAAYVTGMPKVKGHKLVEEDLKKAVADASGAKKGTVVGVSVCWNFAEQQTPIMDALDAAERKLDPDDAKARAGMGLEEPPNMKQPRKWLWQQERGIFEPSNVDSPEAPESDITGVLKALETSEHAFVVFRTEEEREDIVNKITKSGGFLYEGQKLQMQILQQEPGTVNWKNFDNSPTSTKLARLTKGFGCILLGLLFWTTVFYAPYAYSVFSFNYQNGQEPGFVYGFAFSMVVVIGNAIMYEICAEVSDFVGFQFTDDREACYMVLYLIACTFNILLDLVTTFFMALKIMSGLGFKTHDGIPLDQVQGFNALFETYAMQRSLAENTYTYAWPSTYLIPFLIEPFMTIILPYKIGELIVRTHPKIVGRAAEDYLASSPMDMGRYADILLNVLLAILIFFFPGGYTAKLFFFMAAAHCYIYAFDHWRVLRSIPKCTYATMQIDWRSQAMLAPLCALILSCLVLKANGQGFGYDFGDWIVLACCIAFFSHVVVHLLVLIYLVPKFKKGSSAQQEIVPYEQVNRQHPRSWFSCNPVHCLRSHYIYKHKTPCMFFINGREHLLAVNEELGCYFQCEKAPAEDFDSSKNAQKDMKDLLNACCCNGLAADGVKK